MNAMKASTYADRNARDGKETRVLEQGILVEGTERGLVVVLEQQ